MALQADTQRIFDALKEGYGITLQFDDRGFCVLEHEDDFEIFLALSEDAGTMTFAARLCPISTDDPTHLFAELLGHNLTGGLCGPLAFALDKARRSVLLTKRAKLADLDADKIAAILRDLVKGFHYAAGPVLRVQTGGGSLDDEAAALARDLRGAASNKPGQAPPGGVIYG